MNKKRIVPTLGKNASNGLQYLIDAVNLSLIVNNKEALATYHYLQSLNAAINSDEYKERQAKKSVWIKKARQEGKYNSKGKI